MRGAGGGGESPAPNHPNGRGQGKGALGNFSHPANVAGNVQKERTSNMASALIPFTQVGVSKITSPEKRRNERRRKKEDRRDDRRRRRKN